MENEYWINTINVNDEQRLCIECYHCKIKRDDIYCKFGAWKEKLPKIITYVPQDFDCPEFEEA